MPSSIVRQIPNALTVLRLLLGLALPWSPASWQFGMLLVAALTDAIDGTISRWLGANSAFGQAVDPIADKTVVLAAVGTALRQGWLSWPELLAVAARDLAVLGLSGFALLQSRANLERLKPRLSGKAATAGQLAALLALFWFRQPAPLLIAVAAGLSLLSAADYTGFALRAKSADSPANDKPR